MAHPYHFRSMEARGCYSNGCSRHACGLRLVSCPRHRQHGLEHVWALLPDVDDRNWTVDDADLFHDLPKEALHACLWTDFPGDDLDLCRISQTEVSDGSKRQPVRTRTVSSCPVPARASPDMSDMDCMTTLHGGLLPVRAL